MRCFPIFLDVSRKKVLIIGAGAVGMRKLRAVLRAAPLSVTLVDPRLDTAAVPEAAGRDVQCRARAFHPDDLDGQDVVFVAGSDRDAGAAATALCRQRGILCNCADAPDEGDFFVPAHFYRQGLCVAVGTEGRSPALARFLREELEAVIGARFDALLVLLERLRPRLLELGLTPEADAGVFRALVRSPLAEHLQKGEEQQAETLLRGLLPAPLQARAGEYLQGLCNSPRPAPSAEQRRPGEREPTGMPAS
ncbi:MAG: bifunctional precorrin-2 dehydrogenase/sirohydrochlorin ferrochelatase [Desulfovibrio sp.]|jgi:precorrin-2 dehydrogenase/sirohydrochlorin ferrochelatase|nr:bifunctional precorrin-2 dehydrogenase/sirohydrochlorin ferrochelatase [Desulfovibrio sp.]